MVKIRLRRMGARRHLSTASSLLTPRCPRDGRFIEEIVLTIPWAEARTSRSISSAQVLDIQRCSAYRNCTRPAY